MNISVEVLADHVHEVNSACRFKAPRATDANGQDRWQCPNCTRVAGQVIWLLGSELSKALPESSKLAYSYEQANKNKKKG